MLIELLKLSLFPCFQFASAPVITDGGAAGGDDGGAGGADVAVGDDAGGDDGAVEDTGIEEPTDDAVGDDAGDEGVQDEAAGDRDGRKIPANVRQAISKLKEVDPKAADSVRKAWYEAGDYKQTFPTVAAAREARDLLDTVGGEQGITELRTEAQDYAKELSGMAQGDPALIEDLARDYPDGLAKLVPHAIDKLRQVNPQVYEREAAKIISSTLKDRGVFSSMSRIAELIADGKQQAALELTQKLLDWGKNTSEFADSKPADMGESPEAKALKERQAELDKRDASTFRTQTGERLLRVMDQQINASLASYLKTHKLTPQQKSSLISGIRGRLTAVIGPQERYKAVLASKDVDAIERYVRGQLSRERVNKARDGEWALRGFRVPKAGGTTTNGTQATSTATMGTKPRPEEIDWTKDKSRIRFMGDGVSGEATLRNGKVVKFKW